MDGNVTNQTNSSEGVEGNIQSLTLPMLINFLTFPFMVIIGLVCNSLIFIIMRRRRMSHISTCYYMAILAIADTSVLLIGLLVRWVYTIDKNWSLLLQSNYTCKILSTIFYSASDTSVWLVCLMSADRCIAVRRPLHASSICTVRRAQLTTLVLLIIMILINSHFIFTHYLSGVNDCASYDSYEIFTRQIWPWIDAAVYSAIPFIFLLTTNLIIVHSLFHARRSTTHLHLYQSHTNRNKSQLSSSMSRKLTTMLLAVTVFFLLTSFPMACLQIYENLKQRNDSSVAQSYLKPLSETLQYSNHCMNFFIYALTGKTFRDELKDLFTDVAVKMHFFKSDVDLNINQRQKLCRGTCSLVERRPSPRPNRVQLNESTRLNRTSTKISK